MSTHFHITLPHPHRASTINTTTSSSSTSSPITKSTSLPTHPNAKPHVSTPHPHHLPHHLPHPTSYLDTHSTHFAAHHAEFTYQHSLRAAKRDASHPHPSSKIPEYILEADESDSPSADAPGSHQHRHSTSKTKEEIEHDQAEWQAVLAAREKARRRQTLSEGEMEAELSMARNDVHGAEGVERMESAVSGSEGSGGSEGSTSPN